MESKEQCKFPIKAVSSAVLVFVSASANVGARRCALTGVVDSEKGKGAAEVSVSARCHVI